MERRSAILICVICILSLTSPSLYTFSQTIPMPFGIVDIDFVLKNDTQFTAGIFSGQGYLFSQINETATFDDGNLIFNKSSYGVTGTKFSADREWRVICTSRTDLFIHRFNTTTGDYDLVQEIDNGGWGMTKYCDLTDDHEFLAVAYYSVSFIYKFNSTTELFDDYQSFTGYTYVTDLDFTRDGQYLGISDTYEIIIYVNNGANFTEEQTIPVENNVTRGMNLHEEMQYLMVPDYNNVSQLLMKIYKKNNTGQFEHVQTSNYGNELYQKHSISEDYEIMALATQSKLRIITGIKEEIQTVKQQIASNYSVLSISDNKKYILAAGIISPVHIYVNCDYENTNKAFFNTNSSSCQLCDEGTFLVNSNLSATACEPCIIENCIDCLNLTTCVKCNETEGYYVDGGACSFCNESNQSYIDEGECVPCDSQNYFLENSQCQECELQGCLKCESLSACLICDQNSNYILNNETCEKEELTEESLPQQIESLLPYQIVLISVGCVAVAGTIGYLVISKFVCPKGTVQEAVEVSNIKISDVPDVAT